MKRRWIIRGFFIALLLLAPCFALFASYSYGLQVGYSGATTWLVGCVGGDIQICWLRGESLPLGFEMHVLPAEIQLELDKRRMDEFYKQGNLPAQCIKIRLPFWLTGVPSAIAAYWVWRKTRRKPNPKTGFRVDVKQTS